MTAWQKSLGTGEFGVNTDIYKAGLTSIGAVKLNVLLSDAFEGAVIRNKDLKEHNTVERLENSWQTAVRRNPLRNRKCTP